jgi:hypothetical protein
MAHAHETRFRLSAKRTSPFKSAGVSVESTTGSECVRISGSNAGYTMFRGSVKSTGYPLHSPLTLSLLLPASLCSITFQLHSIGFDRINHAESQIVFIGQASYIKSTSKLRYVAVNIKRKLTRRSEQNTKPAIRLRSGFSVSVFQVSSVSETVGLLSVDSKPQRTSFV